MADFSPPLHRLVNLCLENPSGSSVSSEATCPMPADVVAPSPAASEAADVPVQNHASAAVAAKGRVLLLEDDVFFGKILSDCLTEIGCEVVEVENGVEGVREVMARDYSLILCDLMMPSLRGDLFYAAVERIRPGLCDRFIFMTGNREDAWVQEFIRKVNRPLLWKPFRLTDLWEAIALHQALSTSRNAPASNPESVPTSAPEIAPEIAPERVTSGPGVSAAANGLVQIGNPDPHGTQIADKVAMILARAESAPSPRPGVAPAIPLCDEAPDRAHGSARLLVVVGVALLLVLAGGTWQRIGDAEERVEAASAKRQALEAEWSALSPHLEEAVAARAKFGIDQSRLARIAADRTKPRWTPALRCIIPSADAKIEILEIHARGASNDPGGCEVRIRGMAGGPQPSVAANRFRHAVEEALGRNADGQPVSAQFQQLDDLPGTVQEKQKATFVIIATLGSMKPTIAAGKGRR